MKGKYNLAFTKTFSLQEGFENRSRIETSFLNLRKQYMIIYSIIIQILERLVKPQAIKLLKTRKQKLTLFLAGRTILNMLSRSEARLRNFEHFSALRSFLYHFELSNFLSCFFYFADFLGGF